MNVSLYQAASALNANSQWLDVISENLGSTSVRGFRKQSLSTDAVQAGLVPTGSANSGAPQFFALPEPDIKTSFQPGQMDYTGDDKNAGIVGNGFFQVKLPNGATAVTRDGEFAVNLKGQLTTKEGYLVQSKSGSPIQLDIHSQTPISISADGQVSQGEATRGSLDLVDYENPQLLTPTNGVYFLADNPALVSKPMTGTVQQGCVESSNANSMAEMASMMTAMRTFEANQHVIQIQDERLGKVISDLGGTA
jgi:flagellar basal-body rod protein FlgG